MKLHFRHHTPRRLPTGRLIEKAFVPDHGLVARSSYGPRQQLRDVALQAVIGGYPLGSPGRNAWEPREGSILLGCC
jgi:hypothetical protein